MIDWVFSKRQLVNRQTHIRYNCCYLCYDLEQVASLQKREDGFVNFILFKLTKHSVSKIALLMVLNILFVLVYK